MKFIKYTRYSGDDFGISATDLIRALSDFLLRSGFEQQFPDFGEMDRRSLDELQDAVRQALESGQLFDDKHLEEMMDELNQMSPEQFEQLVDRLIGKLADEGYVNVNDSDAQRDPNSSGAPRGSAGEDRSQQPIRFNLTDKGVDFLGYKTLKDLLGSLGKAGLRQPRHAGVGHRR